MKKQAGFTLIELVAVLVILALLGAMAVPRFVDVSSQALTAAQNGSLAGVRSAHAMAIAELRRLPTVTELSTYVGGPVTAAAGGIQVVINSTTYTVATYTDTTCNVANVTTAVGDSVGCIGGIS